MHLKRSRYVRECLEANIRTISIKYIFEHKQNWITRLDRTSNEGIRKKYAILKMDSKTEDDHGYCAVRMPM
jgi:hypothetical protein